MVLHLVQRSVWQVQYLMVKVELTQMRLVKEQYSDIKGVENVEDLFFEFLRVAKDIKPKVIIGENVEGLTMGEAKEYFHKIQNTFEDIGYLIVANVLDSSYFGVPQSRKRCFFIGVREDVAEKVGINFMTMYQLYPDKNDFRTTLGESH